MQSRAYYDAALEAIADGRWVPDPANGLVVSSKLGRALKPQVSPRGYHSIGVRSPFTGKSHLVLLHRVIWESVHGPIPAGLQINHLDGDKGNNRVTNLEVVDQVGNMRHAHDLGLFKNIPRGVNRWNAKATPALAASIRERVRNGETQTVVARSVGLSQSIVSDIVNGKRWIIPHFSG